MISQYEILFGGANMFFRDGYLSFNNIDCVYVESHEGIKLIPKDPQDLYKLNQNFTSKDFLIKYARGVDTNCHARIVQIRLNHMNSITLLPQYILDMFCDEPISYLEIRGKVIDEFFSPSHYFYDKAKKGEENNVDLTRNIEVADKWEINVQGVLVTIELLYGNILRHGVASDLILHPQLRVSFEKSDNPDFIYKIYTIISRSLQLCQCRRNPRRFKVSCHSGNPTYNSGYFWEWGTINTEEVNCDSLADYRYFKPYIQKLFQFAADNLDISFRFLPMSLRWRGSDYTPEELASIFAAFESEYKANLNLYNISHMDSIDAIKNILVDRIKKCDNQQATKEETEFIRLAIDRIKGLGTQTGQTQKIKNVYRILEPALKSSFEWLFPEFANLEPSMGINRIAKEIVGLRSRVSHECSLSKFSDNQAKYIRFLEIIVYSQILKRAGIDDQGIAQIVGIIFNTNYLFIQNMTNSKSNQ